MDRILAALLLTACAALAGVDAPLGPFARPGVPTALASDVAREVDAYGWRFALRAGTTVVALPRLPCDVHEPSGALLLRLGEVPAERLLVGVVGRYSGAFVERLGPNVVVVPLEPERLVDRWQPYDLFDRLYVARTDLPEAVRRALADWACAGGSLCAVDAETLFPGAGRGIGEVVAGSDLDDLAIRAGAVVAHPVPRLGNVRPDVYALWERPAIPRGPLAAARTVAWSSAGACAALLLLGVAARWPRRLVLGCAAVVALAGACLGTLLPSAAYSPAVEATAAVQFEGRETGRLRRWRFVEAVGSGAEVATAEGDVPLLFRRGDAPWERTVPKGVVRVFLRDEILPPPADALGAGDSPAPGGRRPAEAAAPWTVRGAAGAPPSITWRLGRG